MFFVFGTAEAARLINAFQEKKKKWLPAPSLACAGHNSNSVKLSGDSGHELTSPQFKPERKGSLLKCKYQSLALASILSQKGTGMYFA